jgi:hypothetical protein
MTKPAQTSEREWQRTLVELLEAFGYVVEHTYPLLTRPKGGQPVWRTGSTLKGKPDLIALRPPRELAIECKTDIGRLDPRQAAVLSLHALVPCHRAWVLRPSDPWDDIVAWIRRPATAPMTFGFEPMTLKDAVTLLRRKQAR